MSSGNGSGVKSDLKMNLSPSRADQRILESPTRTGTPSPTSPPSSCVSIELNQEDKYTNNSSEATSMVLVGCFRCLMYVMLSGNEPKCPKCKSTVLLNFLHHYNQNNNNNMRRN